jgi:RNA polymerase sigma factor (sigma-70 family)
MIFSRDPLANPQPLIERVYAYVAYRVGEGPDAEDITSETFERAVRYRQTYDRSKGEPVEWLIGIARRVIVARSSGRPDVLTADVPDAASEDRIDERVVSALALRSAVATLDERDRELIALRYGADLTVREIGELLGLRTNTVEVALHRARNRLAAKLGAASEDDWPDADPETVRV